MQLPNHSHHLSSPTTNETRFDKKKKKKDFLKVTQAQPQVLQRINNVDRALAPVVLHLRHDGGKNLDSTIVNRRVWREKYWQWLSHELVTRHESNFNSSLIINWARLITDSIKISSKIKSSKQKITEINVIILTVASAMLSYSQPVNSVSISGMLTPSHLLGQKVKPRWPPMEANFGRPFQSSSRSCTSVLVLCTT